MSVSASSEIDETTEVKLSHLTIFVIIILP